VFFYKDGHYLTCYPFKIKQVEFIRRRQHISTIDTSSPSRLLLVSNPSSNNSFVPNSNIQIHNKNPNAAMGYCTLRNGVLHGPPQSIVTSNSMSMSPVPKAFQTGMNTCTLPRHPNHVNQHWPSYGGTIAGVRNINLTTSTITVSGGQQQVPPPPSSIAMQHLGPTARTRVCIGMPEDDVSAETPLMVKRESTV
jgi:hypothetical protein